MSNRTFQRLAERRPRVRSPTSSAPVRRWSSVYLRLNFDSRRVIITPDYNALNWREQPYGAAAQEEEEELEHAALAPLRRSVVW
ncbi:hypothetical protein EJ998_00160 [Burkholderia cepacia ATCC 25416]|nr:hypothetical protein EJ998_00160 [Burkholderia cepacia ATCC 25416]